jgi:hypothetical protein
MKKTISGREIITYLAIKYRNVWADIYFAIKEKELVDLSVIRESLSNIKGDFVTIIDENYPDALKKIKFPPFVIFLNETDRQNIRDTSSNAYLKHFNKFPAEFGA